jgi:hypothetical protein
MGPRINGSTWIVETGGRGGRFNSLHPQSSYSYLSSGSMISPNPPATPPSSFFYLRLVAFCYFSSSLTRFHPLLVRFPIDRIVHFVKMSLFSQRFKLLNFFLPRTNVNAESPKSALLDPSNFWEIHGNPLRIFLYVYVLRIHLTGYKYLMLCKEVFRLKIVIICIIF